MPTCDPETSRQSAATLSSNAFSVWIASLLILACSLAGARPVAAQGSYFFRAIDDPSASGPSPSIPPRTIAFGINDSGATVGSYSCCDFGLHAFLYSGNTFLNVDYPSNPCGLSHCGSEARGINNSGVIVGDFTDGNGNTQGYTYANGTFNVFDFPGSTYMQPNAINNLGEIVGIYDDANLVQHGFIYNGGFASVDCPNGGQMFLNGVNDAGDLVGYCFVPGQSDIGFHLTPSGQSITISFPGALSTRANGINNLGQVVGEYIDANARFHGFLFSGGKYTNIDVPGVLTEANVINNIGYIAGDFEGTSQIFHGFLAYGAQLVDPVPDLLSGSAVRSPSTLADAQVLATQGQVIQGSASDGVTELLVRIPANNVGDQFTLTVLNDSSQSQSALPNEDGALGKPGDTSFSQTQLSVAAVATNNDPNNPGPVGFAVYRAPIDFARQVSAGLYKSGNCGGVANSDDQAACRTVTLQIQNLTAGSAITLPVIIVRPPVILIHGLWGEPSNWNNFSPLYSDIGGATPDSRLYVGVANYSKRPSDVAIVSSSPDYSSLPIGQGLAVLANARANSLGFQYNARGVMSQVNEHLSKFKSGANTSSVAVAAVQADIVGHSMGGDISRTIALQFDFLAPETFGQGIIHKLITIDTPHLGSPLATQLLQSQNGCVANVLALAQQPAFGSIQGVTKLGPATLTLQGAVGDLADTPSQALQNIAAQGQHPLPTALIAGTINSTNLAGLLNNATAMSLRAACGVGASSPLAQNLTAGNWPNVFNNQPSDAIVSLNSQLDALSPDPGMVFDGNVHSPGTEKLGFAGPSVLDSGPVPTQVINLLNTPVTDPLFHLLNP
jgi:probable HAF family extracellular repeat protein